MSGHMMGTGEDDSQQAAEAMVQLSGIGFYTQPQGAGIIYFSLYKKITF